MLWNESFSFCQLKIYFDTQLFLPTIICNVLSGEYFGMGCVFSFRFEAVVLFVCLHELFNRFPKLRILTLSCHVFFYFYVKILGDIFKSKRFIYCKCAAKALVYPFFGQTVLIGRFVGHCNDCILLKRLFLMRLSRRFRMSLIVIEQITE